MYSQPPDFKYVFRNSRTLEVQTVMVMQLLVTKREPF